MRSGRRRCSLSEKLLASTSHRRPTKSPSIWLSRRSQPLRGTFFTDSKPRLLRRTARKRRPRPGRERQKGLAARPRRELGLSSEPTGIGLRLWRLPVEPVDFLAAGVAHQEQRIIGRQTSPRTEVTPEPL